MPRTYRGPFLYLRHRKGGASTWVIRDGYLMISTRCREADVAKAEETLADYRAAGGWNAYREINTANIARPEHLYFITCDQPNFPVKVGVAADVIKRIASIQTALPYRVELIGLVEGGAKYERSVHLKFFDIRLNGEWFARTLHLLEYIKSVTNTPVSVPWHE